MPVEKTMASVEGFGEAIEAEKGRGYLGFDLGFDLGGRGEGGILIVVNEEVCWAVHNA